MYLFVKTFRSSVGGNAISMKVMDTDAFIEEYKDFVKGFGSHDVRTATLNGSYGGGLLNTLEVEEFEDMFADKLSSMGKLLYYYPDEHSVRNKYPFFRKAVYQKHGIKAKRTWNDEAREYQVEAL